MCLKKCYYLQKINSELYSDIVITEEDTLPIKWQFQQLSGQMAGLN